MSFCLGILSVQVRGVLANCCKLVGGHLLEFPKKLLVRLELEQLLLDHSEVEQQADQPTRRSWNTGRG